MELTTVLDIAEEKINELDDIAMKSFQNEAQRKKDFKQDEQGTPVDCGTISRGQIYVSSKLPKERREKKGGKKYLKIAWLEIFQFWWKPSTYRSKFNKHQAQKKFFKNEQNYIKAYCKQIA